MKIINDTFKTHTVLQNGSHIDTEREMLGFETDRQTDRQTDAWLLGEM